MAEVYDEELARLGLNPYAINPLPEPLHSRMVASWDRVFDVEELRDTNTVQACFERLDFSDIVEATEFTVVAR